MPALFITEYALARLCMAWGIQPKAMLGHSMGEYTAACLAGGVSPETAAHGALRGQLLRRSRPAPCSACRCRNELPIMTCGGSLDIGVVNTPQPLRGLRPGGGIDALEARLLARPIRRHRIRIHVAAHSRMLDPSCPRSAPASRTSIQHAEHPVPVEPHRHWMTDEDATRPEYWVRHLRSPCTFPDNLASAVDAEPVLLEVGPGRR